MRENSPARADKPVILLVAEAVTLAHFGRIATLAKSLDASRFNVVVASDPRYGKLEPKLPLQSLHSIPTRQFEQSLAAGRPVYDAATLVRYVHHDLDLLDRIQPDLVVGDFRLSLAVSAPLRKIPYAAIVNAYWSPWADIRFPVPDLPFTRLLGVGLAQKIFDRVRPFAFKAHARPLNQTRRYFGLPAISGDLRQAYSWSDATLYPDLPDLVPMRALPPAHHFIGPVLWSSGGPLPAWWSQIPADRPLVFLSLGSSGRSDFLATALRALAGLPVTLVVATAGKTGPVASGAQVFFAAYLPIEAVCARARLVICNGGSLTAYWALKYGVPVLGVCTNLDQMLNMAAIERQGAGLGLRAQGVTGNQLRDAARRLLDPAGPAMPAANGFATRMKQMEGTGAFQAVIEKVLG